MIEKDTNLVIGKINTGKTRGVLLKEAKKAIENNDNILFLDNKEEYYKTYSKKLKESGYNVLVFNLKNPLQSHGFNPLLLPYHLYKNNNYDMAVEIIKNLALEIFREDRQESDPFWTISSADFFMGLVLTLFKEGKEDEINLGSIGVMMSQIEDKYQEKTVFRAYLEKLSPLDSIYISASATAFAPTDTRGSIYAVMRQKLNTIFGRENLFSVLCSNEIDLDKLGNNKTAIFIIGKELCNFLANILIKELITVINYKKIPFTLLFDNFDSLPVLTEIKGIIEDATYNNLKVYVAIRSLEEIENRYGKYIFDKFQNTIQLSDKQEELYSIGTDNEYPQFKKQEHNYFNLTTYVKNTL